MNPFIGRILSNRVLSVLVLLCFTFGVHAENIDFSTALHIAKGYVKVSKEDAIRTRSAALQPYYVFNDVSGKGFVIVAGNDKMGQVLAYSNENSLDLKHLNPEVRYLLSAYHYVYDELRSDKRLTTRAETKPITPDYVAPLIKTHWGQDYPYSKFTQYMTGCVATAVAQIMRYHQWPAQGKGTESYTVTSDHTVRSADFTKSNYDWKHMVDDYSHAKTSSQEQDAVAKLMYDVGVATNMQYSSGASGAQSYMAERALRNHFDYDAALVERAHEGVSHFVELVKKELRNGFPLYISGEAKGGYGAHAWVCDGYDKADLFHMNFGWDGQADGFYSLAALNITSTGKEFGGSSLGFNRKLHVIAIHPNKPGVPKIDADIAYGAPNLCFNFDGEMAFVGPIPSRLADNLHLRYSYFVNQSSERFVGDVGVGVYDEADQLIKTFPYAQHGRAIFTKDRFKMNNGEMLPGNLMDKDVVITLDLSALPNGTYTLSPIAARQQEEGSLGSWARMKKAPRMVMQVESGKVFFLEMPSKEPTYQLVSAPVFDKKLRIGEQNSVQLLIRKLDAQPFDGVVKLEMLNSKGDTAYTSQTETAIDFDIFATTKVRIPFNLPLTTAPGSYTLRVTIVKEGNKDTCLVLNRPTQTPYTIDVEAGKGLNIFGQIVTYVQDGDEASMPGEGIDVGLNATFRVNCFAFLADKAQYKGDLRLYLIDPQTDKRIPLMRRPKKVNITGSGAECNVTSDWLNAKNLQIINNRRYRVALIGAVEGEEVDFTTTIPNPLYVSVVNGPYNSDADIVSNGIKGIIPSDAIKLTGGVLEVQLANLKSVSVYTLNGMLIANQHVDATNRVQVTLQKGAYIVRLVMNDGSVRTVIMR